MEKRGVLSIETIIIIILALLVLIVIAASFTGGMKSLFEKIGIIAKSSDQIDMSLAVSRCSALCNNKMAFDTTTFVVTDYGPRACKDIAQCPIAT